MFYWLNDLIDTPLYAFSGISVIADILMGLEWQVSVGHLIVEDYTLGHRTFSKNYSL
jgi:hypothetical protein